MAVGRGPLVTRAGATVEVDLDLIDRATEVGVVDSIHVAVAEIVDVDALFAGAAGAISAGAADAIPAGPASAMVGDFDDAVARSVVVVDLSMPRLSMQQNMEPKVM